MAMNSAAAAGTPAVAVKKASTEEKVDATDPISAPIANPNPNPNPNARASRWSGALVGNAPNSAPEPPQKKVKNDFSSLPAAGEGASGANDGPPGLPFPQTELGAMTAQSLGRATEQASTGYNATQQTSNYQSYGSQYQPLAPLHGSFAPGSAKGTGALFYKTKLCTKFKIGACTFNERCHFAHGVEDLRKPPPLWETMAAGGSATSGLSGGSFIRPKTRPCRYFAEGNCPYNERCNFLHGNEDPQKMQGPTYGASGPYASFSMPESVVVPAQAAQPQGYSGISAHPNGSNDSNSMQFPNPNHMYTAPTQYSNPSTVPSTLPLSYGMQNDYPPSESMVPKATPYGSTMAPSSSINSYPIAPEGINGVPSNFNSWNGSVMPAVNPNPSYIQTNQQITNQGYQTASWMPNYAAGAYPKVENSTAMPQYAQQSQTVSATPYGQGVTQQSGPTMHADAGLYQNTYSGPGYPNPQADYTARYNMAEAWGGQTQ